MFERNGTFFENKTRLTNVHIERRIEKTSVEMFGARAEFRDAKKNRWKKGTIQYLVSGTITINGHKKEITTSSGDSGTNTEKVKRARRNFLAKVGGEIGSYDEDEGIKLLSGVKNLKEGWERFV